MMMDRWFSLTRLRNYVQIPELLYASRPGDRSPEDIAGVLASLHSLHDKQVVVIDDTNMNKDDISPISAAQAVGLVKTKLIDKKALLLFKAPKGATFYKGKVTLALHHIGFQGHIFPYGLNDEQLNKVFPEGLRGIANNIYYEASKIQPIISKEDVFTTVVTYHSEAGPLGRVFFWGMI